MKKVLFSLSALMILWGNLAIAASEEKKVPQPYAPTKLEHMNHSELFDDPQFGRSTETY